jgi:hypothetical protein
MHRKSIRVLEYLDRDAELEEGFRQLRDIRAFLDAHPDFLGKNRLLNRTNDLPEMTYAVIARDHIGTVETEDSLLAEFDALIWALRESANLAEAMRKLQGYEWLPVEGRDFYVRFEASTLALRSRMFYSQPRYPTTQGILWSLKVIVSI